MLEARPIWELVEITKRFPGVLANDRVSLRLDGGEIHGLMGENGCGKSTLIKTLSGAHQPDGGRILRAGEPVTFASPMGARAAGIATVFQEFSTVRTLTVAENIHLGAPLRGRFGIVFHLDFYSQKDLEIIVHRSAEILNVEIEATGAKEIARRARGTPRIANRLLRRVRDYAQVLGDGRITQGLSKRALDEMEVDKFGLDEVDRKILTAIIEKFDGGPVGIGTIAASISEERESIEEIIEPYLIQIGFLNRTPRGRVATRAAYKHLGLVPPKVQQDLLAS